MKRDPFVYIGASVAAFLVVLLALFKPEGSILVALVAAGILVALFYRADRVNKARPCQQCGRRFRGADMVEHHVNEHRVCDS